RRPGHVRHPHPVLSGRLDIDIVEAHRHQCDHFEAWDALDDLAGDRCVTWQQHGRTRSPSDDLLGVTRVEYSHLETGGLQQSYASGDVGVVGVRVDRDRLCGAHAAATEASNTAWSMWISCSPPPATAEATAALSSATFAARWPLPPN